MPKKPGIPSDDDLARYAAGLLPDEECAQIEHYLESDPAAEHRWTQIQIDDPIINQIQDMPHRSSVSHVNLAIAQLKKLPAGTRIGRYELRGLLGQGGMAAVYRAHDPVLDREIAIKVLFARDAETSARAIAEARAQGKLSHPNIVPVYDADEFESGIYIAMEMMSKSVGDLLVEYEAMSVEAAAGYLIDATQGIQAAHDSGLIHRDIKPANLLLSSDGVVKVADFGICRSMEVGTLTTNEQAGTPHFMSPEQCRSDKIDRRSDIYSLGATFFTMITGIMPYADSESSLQVLFAHCESDPPDPCKVRPTLPPACRKLVQRAMAKRPEDRFEGAIEFAETLQKFTGKTNSGNGNSDSSLFWRDLVTIPTGPSLVVLPFENIGGNPDREYFSDGITHEITTQLGRFREIHLIAGRTAFQFKGRQSDLRKIRDELNVQYVLEGAVRQSGNRLRISATLLETTSSNAVWSDSFDKDLSMADIFDIQDEIAVNVTSSLAQPHGQLQVAERSRRKGRAGFDAYDATLRFYEYWHKHDVETYLEVRELLEEVVEANPSNAQATAALAMVYVNGFRVHFVDSAIEDMKLADGLARRALNEDPHSEMAHEALLSVLFHSGEIDAFGQAAEKALTSHPNHADLLADAGLFFALIGNCKRGIALAEKALALSPRPPGWYYAAYYIKALKDKNYEEALQRAFQDESPVFMTNVHRAVALAFLERFDEAVVEMQKALEIYPALASNFRSILSVWNMPHDLLQTYLEGAAKAGLAIS